MIMKTYRNIKIGMFAALVAFAAAPAMSQDKIVIATGIDPSFANFAVSVDKGFFANEGIEAELRSFDDGNVALDSLLTGQADIGASGELGGIARVARGGKIYAVGSAVRSANFLGVVGSKSIANPQDFIGKRVGVPRASSAHLFMGRYFEHHKVDQSKVNMVYLQAPESVAALSRGDIDAFFLWDPWLARAAETIPDTHMIARSGDNNIFELNQYVWFSERLINNPDLAKRALTALVKGSDWSMANRREVAEISAKNWNLEVDFAEKMGALVEWGVRFLPEHMERMRYAGAFALAQGAVDQEPDYDVFLRPDVLEAVDPERLKAQ